MSTGRPQATSKEVPYNFAHCSIERTCRAVGLTDIDHLRRGGHGFPRRFRPLLLVKGEGQPLRCFFAITAEQCQASSVIFGVDARTLRGHLDHPRRQLISPLLRCRGFSAFEFNGRRVLSVGLAFDSPRRGGLLHQSSQVRRLFYRLGLKPPSLDPRPHFSRGRCYPKLFPKHSKPTLHLPFR